MSSEEIQDFYELVDTAVDTDKIRNQVLERICRLEDVLKEQLYWAKRHRDSNDYRDRSLDEKIDLFGSEATIGSILDARENMVEEIKWLLHVVRSILLSLALPIDCEGSPEFHVRRALEVIEGLLYENSVRREIRTAERKTTDSFASTQRDQVGFISATSSKPGSSNAQERPNSAAQDDHSPIPDSPRSPYVKFMNKLDTELGARAAKMKKHEIKLYIEQRWDAGALGEPSAHKVDMMATMMRPPEAQKGRATPKP